MAKALLLCAICLAAVGGSACHRLRPASHPPYTVTAVVEAVAADAITLRHKSGQRIHMEIAPATAVTRREGAAAVSDIAVGMRVVVIDRFVGAAAVADEVRLFRPPA